MVVTKNTVHLPALLEYREATAKRRAEAFCDVPDYVLGTPVKPLTPATFSMLYALKSAFIFDTAKAGPVDVINFLWIHSPLHSHTGVRGWRSRKRKAIRSFVFELTQPWRKWLGLPLDPNRYNAVLNLAVADIRRICDEAFADSPARSGRPAKPIATLEAFLIHEFAAAYRWEPERTRHEPIKRLLQLHRCICAARGEETTDDGEDRIWAEHMDQKQAEFDAKERVSANG